MSRSSRWRWPRRIIILTLVLVALYATSRWSLPAAARVLDVSDRPQRVDYALILAGNVETRPFAAAGLYQAGLAPVILTAQTRPMPVVEEGTLPPEHELVARILRARGVPESAFQVLPGACESTRDEARALASFLADKPNVRVAVVTTDYHTRRTRWLFERELGARMANVVFIGVPTDGFTPDNWWRFEEGWMTYLDEYLKIVYHAFRR